MENLGIYKNIGIIIFCYFLGAIPFCYIIAKICSRKDLTKITMEADQMAKKPGLVITIEDIASTTEKEWILIPLSVFSEMLEQELDQNL